MRMYLKEVSLRKKEGWKEYSERSWILIPKINGRFLDSVIIYGLATYIGVWMYNKGGIVISLEIFGKLFEAMRG